MISIQARGPLTLLMRLFANLVAIEIFYFHNRIDRFRRNLLLQEPCQHISVDKNVNRERWKPNKNNKLRSEGLIYWFRHRDPVVPRTTHRGERASCHATRWSGALGIGLGFHPLTPATTGGHVARIPTPDANQEGGRRTPGFNSQVVEGKFDKNVFINLSGFGIEDAKPPHMNILCSVARPGQNYQDENGDRVASDWISRRRPCCQPGPAG